MVYPSVPFRSLPGVLECVGTGSIGGELSLSITEWDIDAAVGDGGVEVAVGRTVITATIQEASIVGSIIERDIDTEV